MGGGEANENGPPLHCCESAIYMYTCAKIKKTFANEGGSAVNVQLVQRKSDEFDELLSN